MVRHISLALFITLGSTQVSFANQDMASLVAASPSAKVFFLPECSATCYDSLPLLF